MNKTKRIVATTLFGLPLISLAQISQNPASLTPVGHDLIIVERAGSVPVRSREMLLANGGAAEANVAQTQTALPRTRAQVEADLARVERAGYNPFRNDGEYPEDLQAADAKVDGQRALKVSSPAVAGETRAQVRADLIKVEKAGYDPFRVKYDYPEDIEAAEAKIAAQSGAGGHGISTPVAKIAKPGVPRIDLPRSPFTDGA